MTIRTVSQLPSVSEKTSLSSALMEVSIQTDKNTHTYQSKSITFDQISKRIVANAESQVQSSFNIVNDNGSKRDLNKLNKRVIDLYSTDQVNISGQKIYASRIRFTDKTPTENLNNNDASTINDVKELIRKSPTYIGTQSYLSENPLMNGGIDSEQSHFTVDNSSEMLYFHIDDGGTDSSKSVDEFVQSHKMTQCNHTGHLVIYGWLSQQGEVEPQNAWVALCGKILVKNEQKWVILQLQPWHINDNSTKMQYVSFNLNVKIGLNLKVVTGFKVDGHSSGFQLGNSLGFSNNTPNTLVGYVIRDVNER